MPIWGLRMTDFGPESAVHRTCTPCAPPVHPRYSAKPAHRVLRETVTAPFGARMCFALPLQRPAQRGMHPRRRRDDPR